MDAIGATADRVAQARQPRHDLLSIYTDLRDKLIGCPRYLFDDKAIATAVEITIGRPKVLLEALHHLVIPYPLLWVEWPDAARRQLRVFEEVENRALKELRPMPSRVGFLLETAPGGRSGTATWVWTSAEAKVELGMGVEPPPAIGHVQPYFDLDREFVMPAKLAVGLHAANLWKLWEGSPLQAAALQGIWATAEHRPSPWGERYLKFLGRDNPVAEALAYADVVGELIQLYSCLLLLTASRPVLDLAPVSLTKLNKARTRSGKRPLLEYHDVTLKLTPHEQRPVVRAPLGYTRKGPRIHYVSRYLARRGNRHWVVEPYLRGSGEWVTRRVNVQG